MFGAPSADLILRVAKSQGYMYQLPLVETPPEFTVDPSCLCSIPVKYSFIDEHGQQGGLMHSVEHPAVAAVRTILHNKGYLENHCGAINADTVVKPFVFNSVLYEEGQRFVCASALGTSLRINEKLNTDW